MQYESSLLKTTSSRVNYEVNAWRVLDLHPGNPEIVFLRHCSHEDVNILTFDLRSQELRFFDEPQCSWSIFQPKIFCWPTPIPRYEKLQGLYGGSHNCWVQRSSKATTTPSPVSLVSHSCQNEVC
ncbi:unnamed protein product [Linum tenue]|uniref:DUF295 domain-containing protein n=1 Tax=Linum tenue TaxID=586396 RepID=A0AAV0HEQ6_9ROSI|nr:unnamed protein product [Linum tenue]